MPVQLSEAELLSAFRDFLNKQGQGPAKFEPGKNHPLHRGLVDENYVRPAPTEFPKMLHHPAGMTKIVQDRAEQDALEKSWSEQPAKRVIDWRSKLGEVATKSGYAVRDYHVTYLQVAEVPGIETVRDAAQFLDQLTPEEQEQFFREAELVAEPAQPKSPAPDAKKGK